MMAFDHVFWELARAESRAITAFDPAGTPSTFLFRELYCIDPGCDCRRVVLHVHWVEGRCVAASINYAFEPSRRRDEPQISLDPLNPQSERSMALLALFTELIATDGELRDRLHQHYAMWKRVVDDPSHPDHAKVAPPRRKRRSRRERAAASQGVGLVIARAARADGKLQQRFKRLLEKVDGLRQRLRVWKEQRPVIASELAAYAALFDKQCTLGRDMVNLLDRSYSHASLSKADRKKLAATIASLAAELIELGGNDELKAIYNRYSRSDFDVEVAAADAAGVEAMKAMAELLGVELGDVDVASFDKLETQAEERRTSRKKSAKQVASEARRADEQRSAHKAVQEVYRALALALHPDREQDPDERVRKTELMREVNVAYEAKDLLRLLELQLEVERVDAARVEAIAEDRVQHYNRVLDEQAKQLAIELDEIELPFRVDMGLLPTSPLSPADIVERIRRDTADVQQRIASLASDLAAFEDVSQLKAFLKVQARSRRRRDGFDDDLFG